MLYDEDFHGYTAQRNGPSATLVTRILFDLLRPTSVVDFGCGAGVWLNEWARNGVADVVGLEGAPTHSYPNLAMTRHILEHDLSQPIDLARKFDLAQSLEVAEHIPAEAAEMFVRNLVGHSSTVLFSAAPPGQGGRGHVNEQPYEYWRDLFADHGYQLFDAIRPLLAPFRQIQFYYRYNTFLFVDSATLEALPSSMTSTLVEPHQPISDVSPNVFRLRKTFVRCLPRSFQDWISRVLSARA